MKEPSPASAQAVKSAGPLLGWLDDLPPHWDVAKLKLVANVSASNVDKQNAVDEHPVRLCNYTDVYYNDYIEPNLDFMAATATPREIEQFQLKGGEVLLTKDSETAEDIAIPAYVPEHLDRVLCGYHLYILRPSPRLDGRYLFRACSVSPIRDQYVVAAHGITRYGLGQQELGSAYVPVPPLETQHTIATYLDRETAKIDALIDKKQRLIELLQEKRTALITQAVTQGLDPDVGMKDSGVEWLGEIPAHWDLVQLRYLVRSDTTITYGIVQAGPDIQDGIPYIRTGDMTGNSLPRTGYKRTSKEIAEGYRRSKVSEGDVVVAIRATVGKALLVPDFLEGANLTQGTAKVAPGAGVLSEFLLYALKSTGSQQRFTALSKGATFREITLDMLRRFEIAIPPLDEQRRIVESLRSALEEIAALVGLSREAIDRLCEYRTALISAAVTGKIDVREEPQ